MQKIFQNQIQIIIQLIRYKSLRISKMGKSNFWKVKTPVVLIKMNFLMVLELPWKNWSHIFKILASLINIGSELIILIIRPEKKHANLKNKGKKFWWATNMSAAVDQKRKNLLIHGIKVQTVRTTKNLTTEARITKVNWKILSFSKQAHLTSLKKEQLDLEMKKRIQLVTCLIRHLQNWWVEPWLINLIMKSAADHTN